MTWQTHFYNVASGTRREKTASAITGVGISILGGAATTMGAGTADRLELPTRRLAAAWLPTVGCSSLSRQVCLYSSAPSPSLK